MLIPLAILLSVLIAVQWCSLASFTSYGWFIGHIFARCSGIGSSFL